MKRTSHTSIAVLLTLSFVALTSACTDVSTVRMGSPAPPRPLDCPLELIDAPASSGMPPGLELLGYVRVLHDEGRGPTDPAVLKLVKPEACKLGGEQVSSGMSMNFSNGLRSGSSLTYAVWRRKPAHAAEPTRF